MNVESGLQIGDVWGIVRRRLKVVVAAAGVVTLAAYWVAMALANQYESYATVLVEPQSVDPDLVAAGVKTTNLNDRLHLMTARIMSRSRLSRVIDDLDLYQEESESMVRETVIDLMRSKVRVEPVFSELEAQGPGNRRRDEDINTFRIVFSDDDARTAMVVVQRLSNDFIQDHIDERVKLTQKSLDFIDGELERLAQRIRNVESRVAAVKEANPGRLPEDMQTVQRRYERLLGELQLANRMLNEARSDVEFHRSQAAAATVEGTSASDDVSPTRRMKALELALRDYTARGFTEKHPDVIKTKLELEELRQHVAELTTEAESEEESPSYLQHRSMAEVRRAQLKVTAAEREIDRIQQMLDETQALLAETPAVAEQLDGLEREYRHLFGSYQDFSNRQLEATVQAQLERRQLGEQFRVLEAAFMAPEPSSPNRPVIILLGAIFGLALGGGLGIVLESVDPSVHSARQLQSSMRIPVLASIPEIMLAADRAKVRRRRLRQAFASVAVIGLGLAGGAANYVWVNGTPGFVGALLGDERAGPEAAGVDRDTTAAVGDGG